MGHSLKGVATLLGFVFGVSGAGIAITAGIISLLATIDKISQLENFIPSLSSAIALTLAIATLVTSFLLIKGSLWIWRFSIYGGALNLALGFVTLILSYGNMILLSGQIASGLLRDYILTSYLVASIFSITSGVMGSSAHRDQLVRRFAQSSSSSPFKVQVSIDGRHHDIEVSGYTTGKNLKEKACEIKGISSEDARLLFRGKAVQDGMNLKELGASNGDVFTLVTA